MSITLDSIDVSGSDPSILETDTGLARFFFRMQQERH
jgi:hypothetical protein